MAAFDAVETFEGYGTGGLNGDNGGSNWSAAWVADSGAIVVSTPTFAGTRALKLSSGGSPASADATRNMTASVTSGIARVYMYATNVPTGTKGFFPAIFNQSSTLKFCIGWGTNATYSNGNTIAFGDNGTNWVTLSTTASAATWYYVDVEFDQANNRARASFNGGAWSSYVTAAGGSYTSITQWRFTTADGNVSDQGYYVDNIGVGTGPVTAVNSGFFMAASR